MRFSPTIQFTTIPLQYFYKDSIEKGFMHIRKDSPIHNLPQKVAEVMVDGSSRCIQDEEKNEETAPGAAKGT